MKRRHTFAMAVIAFGLVAAACSGTSYEILGSGQDAEGNAFTLWHDGASEFVAVSWGEDGNIEEVHAVSIIPGAGTVNVAIMDCGGGPDFWDNDGTNDIVVFSHVGDIGRFAIVHNGIGFTQTSAATFSVTLGDEGWYDAQDWLPLMEENWGDCVAAVGL